MNQRPQSLSEAKMASIILGTPLSILLVVMCISSASPKSAELDWATFTFEHPLLAMIGTSFLFWLLGLAALAITVYVVVRVIRYVWKGQKPEAGMRREALMVSRDIGLRPEPGEEELRLKQQELRGLESKLVELEFQLVGLRER